MPSQNGSMSRALIKYHRNKKEESRKNQEQPQGLYRVWHKSYHEDLRKLAPVISLLLTSALLIFLTILNNFIEI